MLFSRIILLAVILTVALLGRLLAHAEEGGEQEVDTFSEIDVNQLDNGPIRFGVKFWDWETWKYKKLFKAFGPVLNTGHWPTLWEVSQSAPAPWEATDERMDLWVTTIYRNLYEKKDTMLNASYVFSNASIDVIGFFLGLPEAYSLSYQQKEYRATKEAEEEGKEADLSDFYYTYNGVDAARMDDAGKFFASSVDHVLEFGAKLRYVELFDRSAVANKDEMYIAPEEFTYLVKRARDEMDARNIRSDKVQIMAPGVEDPGQLVPYLKALSADKEAYDKLYAITTHVVDKGNSLFDIENMAIKLRKNMKKYLPSDWDTKPVVVSGFRYEGPDEVEYHGMRFYGNIEKCYDDKYQRTGHMILKDSICQSPWFAVRMLAGVTLLMSHGLPWIVYNQGADQWWQRHCNGLLDRDNRPKQIMAAFESVLPYMTNETYPISKQWKNVDDCYISAFKSVQKKMRVIIVVTNFSPKVCERSFSLQGIDLWDIQKGRIITYNNGTVAVNADKPYRVLLTHKLLNYDIYDVEDGSNSGPDIEFDLTVGAYASATAIIDAKAPKGRRKAKPKTDTEDQRTETVEGQSDEEEEEVIMDETKILVVEDDGSTEPIAIEDDDDEEEEVPVETPENEITQIPDHTEL